MKPGSPSKKGSSRYLNEFSKIFTLLPLLPKNVVRTSTIGFQETKCLLKDLRPYGEDEGRRERHYSLTTFGGSPYDPFRTSSQPQIKWDRVSKFDRSDNSISNYLQYLILHTK